MGMAANAPVETPFGKRHGEPSGEGLEQAGAVRQEVSLRLSPRPPTRCRFHAHAEIADLAFVADRKVRIGEAKIRNEAVDRGAQMKDKGADPDAQTGAGEPQVQLIRRQVADLYEVDGAISPSSSNSWIRRSIISNGGLSSAISNWSARRWASSRP